MADTPLIVPITVEALVANDDVRNATTPQGYGFQRLLMAYEEIANPFSKTYSSAWPGTSTDDFTVGSPSAYNGVYLKWRLPAALTRGSSDGQTVSLPLVPNRWLVVRFWAGSAPASPASTRQMAAWVVVSDAENDTEAVTATSYAQLGSPYVRPQPGTSLPGQYSIGTNGALGAAGWSEPGTPAFLTAVAPGNPAFAVFQPANNNVFSFFDNLYGEPEQELTYCVVGWYSDPANDPLTGGSPTGSPPSFEQLLAGLGWTIAAPGDLTTSPGGLDATTSLYSGFVMGVQWVPSGSPPTAGLPSGTISIGVGSSSAAALTSLLTFQGAAAQGMEPQLLAAVQLDALQLLDQPGGEVLLAEKIAAGGFQKTPGGFRWHLLPAITPGSPPSGPTAEQLAALVALNSLQEELETAQRLLAWQQSQLYVTWWQWLNVDAIPPAGSLGLSSSELEQQLDAADPTTYAGAVAATAAQVLHLRPRVAEAAAALSSLPGLELKRSTKGRFYAPTEPVVLLAGAGATGIVANSPDALPCRFPDQLVSGLRSGEDVVTAPGAALGELPTYLAAMSGVPWAVADVVGLLEECFLLDPLNAPSIALEMPGSPYTEAEIAAAMEDPVASAVGTLPPGFYPSPTDPGAALPLQQWQGNPWHPIFLSWAGELAPIGYYGPDEQATWSFDGDGYVWNGKGTAPQDEVMGLSGQVVLTPAAAVNLTTQIDSLFAAAQYRGGSPGSPGSYVAELYGLWELLGFVQTNDAWDLVSQSLDGFNEQLSLRSNGAFLDPAALPPGNNPNLAIALGGAAGYPPALGAQGSFQPWRCGTFTFTQLAVVDEWGQKLQLIDSTQGAPIYPSAHDFGSPQVLPPDALLVPPNLLQPARLRFHLLDGAGGDAVRGWVLPNLLDRSLMVYDSAGNLYGEVIAGAADHLCWLAGGSGSPSSPPDLGDPQFAAFVQTLLAQTPATFAAFFAAVDGATAGILTPDGSFDQSLALLLGRPLAFVCAELALELDGPAAVDPSWAQALRPPPEPPLVTTYPFAIRLGNVGQAGDGLVGYFLEDDYDIFNVVPSPGTVGSGYLAPIGAAGNWIWLTFGCAPGGSPPPPVAKVSMLLDPRLPVYALTGILPAHDLRVPRHGIKAALDRMKVTFRVGTILTDQAPAATVPMPAPTQRHAWSWVETAGGVDSTYQVAAPGPNALLSNQLPILRRGLLQLAPRHHHD